MNRAKVDGQPIDDEDRVLVRQQERADPGKIVVALVDGEATVKKLVIRTGLVCGEASVHESETPAYHRSSEFSSPRDRVQRI